MTVVTSADALILGACGVLFMLVAVGVIYATWMMFYRR